MKTKLITWLAFLLLVSAQCGVLAQATVEVLRPNASDRLQPGTTFRIQWRTQGLGTNIDWTIGVYTNSVGFSSLSSPRVYDGDGNWHSDFTVPADWPFSCGYTLNINDDVSERNDDSEAFCVGVPLVTLRVSQVEICWTSRSNRMYQVQYRSTLTTNLWTNLGVSVQGNGSANCITDAVVPGQPQRYYRVEELP